MPELLAHTSPPQRRSVPVLALAFLSAPQRYCTDRAGYLGIPLAFNIVGIIILDRGNLLVPVRIRLGHCERMPAGSMGRLSLLHCPHMLGAIPCQRQDGVAAAASCRPEPGTPEPCSGRFLANAEPGTPEPTPHHRLVLLRAGNAASQANAAATPCGCTPPRRLALLQLVVAAQQSRHG
jgi:hypothetical protein